MDKFPVTLAVITHNEAHCIARCLDSVPFAADKLVVDSGSDDDTVAIAQAHGARVVTQPWLGFGAQRNFASTQALHDWILVLDADECLSPALVDELERTLPALMAGPAPAAVLRRRTIFMGSEMRFYRPSVGEKLARLYHRGRARWTDARVHESLRYRGTAPLLQAPFDHFNNPTLPHKELKSLRYAELKCRDWHEQDKPLRMWLAPLVFLSTFAKDYLLRLGFLDGWRGYIISQTAASYAVYKRMRYFEMVHHPESVEQAATLLRKHGIER